jgi:hypothetical protein
MARQEARHVAEHRERAPVRPVEVVEHEEHGRRARERPKELGHRIERALPVLARIEHGRLGKLAEDSPQLRHELGDDRSDGGQLLAEPVGLRVRGLLRASAKGPYGARGRLKQRPRARARHLRGRRRRPPEEPRLPIPGCRR